MAIPVSGGKMKHPFDKIVMSQMPSDKKDTERRVVKRRWFTIVLLVLLTFLSVIVYAHPGRTDGKGGHTNHSTGEYHYHHGYGPHQHSDPDGDGVDNCPYDFKDNTVHKGSSFNNSASSFTDEYNRLREQQAEDSFQAYISKFYEEKTITNEKETPNREEVIETILAIIFFGPLILYVPISLISFVCGEVRDLIQKLKKK